MRAFRVLTTIILLAVLYLLLVLPGQVAEHMFVAWIADGIREYTGLELPRLETVLGYISFLMPLLAAGAAMYLYHKAYVPTVIRKYQPIREGTRRIEWRSYFAGLFLFSFVVGVAYAGYVDQFRPAIPGPTKYLELRHLPNAELRERAFAVAGKLHNLSKEYEARQSEINSQYEKEKAEFDKHTSDYEQAKEEYEKAKVACPGPSSSGGLILALPTCTPPAGPPSPPGEAPSYPVVSVEPAWAAQAQKVEEEAGAVWEEMHHRFGGYVPIFDVPQNYNPGPNHLSEWASALEDNANQLH